MDLLSDEVESVLFVAREVLVYRIPPRTSTEGYKAASWSEGGAQPIWKGRLRLMELSGKGELRLEDPNTGSLFASTPLPLPFAFPTPIVEPVLDSSRYFVIRIEGEQGSGKRAYIGMGFEERGEAFDFNVALQSLARSSEPATSSSSTSQADSSKPSAPPKDFSLKDGQTFSIKLPGRDRPGGAGSGGSGVGGGSAFVAGGAVGGIPLLAPPPPSGRKR